MSVKEFSKELEKRTRDFVTGIIKLSMSLPNSPESKAVKTQLTKAGTSIGANYREANRSRSRADFKNKIEICESEASETEYWLEIILDMKWLKPDLLKSAMEECREILAIFTAVGNKCR